MDSFYFHVNIRRQHAGKLSSITSTSSIFEPLLPTERLLLNTLYLDHSLPTRKNFTTVRCYPNPQ